MPCFGKAAITQDVLKVELVLSSQSALHLKVAGILLYQGFPRKMNVSLAVRRATSLKNTSVLRCSIMEVKMHSEVMI